MTQVKLSSYLITMHEKVTKRKTPLRFYNFDNIITDKYGSYNFKEFFMDFVKTFDVGFRGLVSEGNAIRLTEDISIKSETGEIEGYFLGGTTGSSKEVHPMTADEDKDIIFVSPDQVTATRYYFKLHINKEHSHAILIVQGFSNESSATVFSRLFHKYLHKSYAPKIVNVASHKSPESVKEILRMGEYEMITLTKHNFAKDKANNILGKEVVLNNLRVKIIFEGQFDKGLLNKIFEEKRNSEIRNANFFTSKILNDFDFSSQEFDTSVKMRNKGQRRGITRKSKKRFIADTDYYVPYEDIILDNFTQLPTKNSLKMAVDKYCNIIKKEVYEP